MTDRIDKKLLDTIDNRLHVSIKLITAAVEGQIEKSVEKTVNGKIRALSEKFDRYVEGDLKWKEDVVPVVSSYKTRTTVQKAIRDIALYIIPLGTAGGIIIGIIHYFK